MRWLSFALLLSLTSCPATAPAKDNGQWEGKPAAIREWFAKLMMPDNPQISCCGTADAFEADDFERTPDGHYIAIITSGRSGIPTGTKVVIPDAKIKWDQGNPTEHGWVFMNGVNNVYCYCPPSSI